MRYLWLVLIAVCAARADSIPYALQNNGFTAVSLAGDPTVTASCSVPDCQNHPEAPYIEFSNVPPGTSALTVDGKAMCMVLPASGATVIEGFAIPRDLYSPASAVLDVNGTEYSFQIVEAVPEPGALVLVGTGLLFTLRRRTTGGY